MNIALKAEQLFIVRVIRAGLVSMIPVLMVGAFALVLKSFPVVAYQEFITTQLNGFLFYLFDLVYLATFGVMAVYMTLFISRAFANLKAEPQIPIAGAMASSLIAFFMLAGINSQTVGIDYLGPKSMFMAILTGLGASALYFAFYRLLNSSNQAMFSRGADAEFNKTLSTIVPIALTAAAFALFNAAIVEIFDVESFRELIIRAFSELFEGSGASFGGGLMFVLLSSTLWFFGIHGSDTLESVMQEYFVPGLAANQAAVAMGAEPTHILTKQFFDCFVLMGGCGTTICLLIAILAFSRNRGRRRLGVAATLPMIFNINELMVFGLPIIYNPIMLVPFLSTPLACFLVSYFAVSSGLVPVVTGEIEWTTPILIGGYYATGSIAGSLLQLFNVAMGMLIYMPFVRMLDRQSNAEALRVFNDFLAYFKENEAELASVKLIEQQSAYGEFARELTAELQHDTKEAAEIYYQPQYNYEGTCTGVEALLRWKHPLFGMLYPPLVIKLAEDGGFLADLEETIIERVMNEADEVRAKFGSDIKLSFNVTGITVITDRFVKFCHHLGEKHSFENKVICLEITEQATVSFDDETLSILRQLRSMGLTLAIDDFSMGHTSLNYLKNNDLFDIIKLDGSLVRGLSATGNCHEIIASIVQLADTLNMTVVAEYVETEEQRDELHEIGCDCYQGWLYSPAVPLK